MATGSPSDTAGLILSLASERPATLGAGRLICVDGPAGSGKTTLGAELARRTGAQLVNGDDLMSGWRGLDAVGRQLTRVMQALAEGRTGHYLRYDWDLAAYVETVAVAPVPLLVLEGVGSGSRAHADLCTVLVWVEAPAELRLSRGIERDGAALEEHWRQWMRNEAEHFAREDTRARADLVVDGTGIHQPVNRWET